WVGLVGRLGSLFALAVCLSVLPRVLVFVEPTAHLNPDTRDAVIDDLLAAAEGYSTLLITHDLTWLERVDHVYVVRDGKVLQSGTHEELLAEDGWYRSVSLVGESEGSVV